jgi:5-formyltetrahydrofolate cyclo-ligase
MVESRDKLRRATISHRRALAQADCLAWSHSIQARAIALSHYRAAPYVALYSPVENEVATQVILDDALSSGKMGFYPKLNSSGSSDFARVRSLDDFIDGGFGIPEPAGADSIPLGESDNLIVFVPGVLFDRCGNRLGRGGGWYDRVLSKLGSHGVFVGLAYEFQVVDGLAAESWDQRVHFIITEKSVIDCGSTPHESKGIGRYI